MVHSQLMFLNGWESMLRVLARIKASHMNGNRGQPENWLFKELHGEAWDALAVSGQPAPEENGLSLRVCASLCISGPIATSEKFTERPVQVARGSELST